MPSRYGIGTEGHRHQSVAQARRYTSAGGIRGEIMPLPAGNLPENDCRDGLIPNAAALRSCHNCTFTWPGASQPSHVGRTIAEIGRRSPETVRGYRELSGAGGKKDLLGAKTRGS